ncbi:hypothetical protein ABZ934_25390 [Streptomyces sp. NPDC046557]
MFTVLVLMAVVTTALTGPVIRRMVVRDTVDTVGVDAGNAPPADR